MAIIYDHLGIPRKTDDINAVVRLFQMKEANGSNPWPVIEECFNIWSTQNPEKWDSYLIYLDSIKQTRKDKKFASTKDKVTGGYLRYTIDIPQKVMYMIRQLYNSEELDMNRDFWMEFAKKFPKLRIAEKL